MPKALLSLSAARYLCLNANNISGTIPQAWFAAGSTLKLSWFWLNDNPLVWPGCLLVLLLAQVTLTQVAGFSGRPIARYRLC